MLPETLHPSMMSFILLRHRRKVDLPQPEGPISAVTSLGMMSMSMPNSACLAP